MKILVTGAQGQLGSELRERAPLFAFSKAALDITNLDQLKQLIDEHEPDVIVNAAAYTAVDRAELEPEQAFRINRDGVKNLASVCRDHQIPLLHLSTDYVFNGEKSTAYEETDACAPLGVYGASKAAGEKLLQEIWDQHLIIRVSWVFGRYGHNFVKTILRLAGQQKTLRIVADQRGCPTPANDLAETLLQLAQQALSKTPTWGIFHYSGDRPVSWYEFAKTIVEQGRAFLPVVCEEIHPITTAEYPTPAKRPSNSVMNLSKIKKAYGISPSNWEEALQRMLKSI